eukprot:CAMPEP_0198541828 /NCGR_PEP_ID=MMETSP1462-20131121/55244_1 /TAXON_ID=1333877 /ORGANISM="Brandtodinium nutriculum, Strain RCC3387" /LENGTH=66 /DNA_ID=CAMNT_0044272015 /DNA_START=13 /DNA_END=210 /DNA_ORIENTATION=+
MSCAWGDASLAQVRSPRAAGTSGQCMPGSAGGITVNGEELNVTAAMAGPCSKPTTQAACEGTMVTV